MQTNIDRQIRNFSKKKTGIKCLGWLIIILLILFIFLILILTKNNISYFNDSITFNLKKLNNKQLTDSLFISEMKQNETLQRIVYLENELAKINTKLHLNEEQREQECSLIFVMSSAYAGNSHLFSVISSNQVNVDTYYKSPPTMSGTSLLKVKSLGLEETYYTRFNEKIPAIENFMRSSSNTWFDASYLFIESFYDIALDHFLLQKQCNVTIIDLQRYLPHVINDLVEEDFVKNERQSYHSYESKTAILPKLPYRSQRSIDNIIWYLLDVQLQKNHIKQKYPTANYINLNIQDLATQKQVISLFNKLGIQLPFNQNDILVRPITPPTVSQSTLKSYSNDIIQILKEYSYINITIDIDPSLFDTHSLF